MRALGTQHVMTEIPFEDKAKLARWCQQYCPQIHPPTFIIDELSCDHFFKHCTWDYPDKQQWVIKPAKRNNGEGHILSNTAEVVNDFHRYREFSGEHVVQFKLTPKLIDRHAFTVRMLWVAIQPWGAYCWPQGYVNQCTLDYCDQQHHTWITNEHAGKFGQSYNTQTLATDWQGFVTFRPVMITMLQALCSHWQLQNYTGFYPKLALMGADFMIDHNDSCWLLEVNHSPCFPVSPTHPLQRGLYRPFGEWLLQEILAPALALQRPQPVRFQPLCP